MMAKKAAAKKPAAKPAKKAAAKKAAAPKAAKAASAGKARTIPVAKSSKQRAIEDASPYMPPEKMTEVHLEHYRQICDLNVEWAKAIAQHDLDAAKALESKRKAESIGKQLHDCVNRGPDPQRKLPFSDAPTVNPDVDPDESIESAIGSELGPVRIAALKKFGMTKMRELVAHVGQNKALSEIPGITRETAENMDDLIRAWERKRTNAK